MAVSFVAVAALALFEMRTQPVQSPATPAERRKLVVLPFENLGPPEDAYFAAGMTEEITSRLGRVGSLGVISRNSAFRYAGTEKTNRQIGEALGVGFVLEGTVRWARQAEGQGRVCITPQLIRVDDDTQLWSDSYDRVLDDFFAVQSEIAEAVVGQLGVALLPAEQRAIAARPTQSLEAHQAYLRGLEYYWDPDLAKESLEDAVRMFERAVSHDPAFVAARGLLSEAHSRLYWYWYDKSPERLEAAREAAPGHQGRDGRARRGVVPGRRRGVHEARLAGIGASVPKTDGRCVDVLAGRARRAFADYRRMKLKAFTTCRMSSLVYVSSQWPVRLAPG